MADVDLVALRAELTRDEGIRLHPYLDSVGKTTIGVGRNLTDVGISLEECTYLLTNDIKRAMDDLDTALPWWRHLDGVRQRVLVNMAFNLGIGTPGGQHGLLSFPHTLNLMESGQYEEAADAMLHSLWAKQVGPRAQRLADMMRKGDT